MSVEQTFKPETIKAVKEWKRTIWREEKDKDMPSRFGALEDLVEKLAEIYQSPVEIEYESDIESCCYHPETKTIYMNDSVSIISLLHEFAHHLYGADETKACKWSVWLFKKTFPIAFSKLEWKGHMLVKAKQLFN